MRVSSNSKMTEAQSKVFGAEVKRLRRDAGLSISQFAEVIEISSSYVANIEGGHKKPSPQLADRIARTFNMTVEQMLTPQSEREREARINFGKAIAKRRNERGYSMSLVAGALGIPVAVYKEYEQGLCSIPERNIETLHKLLVDEHKPQAEEPKPVEPAEDSRDSGDAMPAKICDIILEHVTDLKVDKSIQKEIWHYFSRVKLDAEERRLFG